MSHGYPGENGNGYPEHSEDAEYDADGFPRRLGGPQGPAGPSQQDAGAGGGGWPQVRNNPGPSMYGQGQQGNGYPQAANYPQAGGYPQTGNYPQTGGWQQQGRGSQQGRAQQQGQAPQQGNGGYGRQGGAGYAEQGYTEPGYAEPGYAAPGYAESGYAEPGYAEPGYAGPGRATPGYGGAGGVDATAEFPQGAGGSVYPDTYPDGSPAQHGQGGPGGRRGRQEETPAFAQAAVGAPTRQQPTWGRGPETEAAPFGDGALAGPARGTDVPDRDPRGTAAPGTPAYGTDALGADALRTDALRTDVREVPAGSEAPAEETAAKAPAKKPGRDRYLDLLRSVALVRVVLFHVYNQAWMTVIFPSMGVMFALAGSLMARSLSGRPGLTVIKSRVRRLMVPVWLFAVVTLVLIFNGGWKPTAGEDGESIIWWWVRLAWWFVPVGAAAGPDEIGSPGGLLDVGWAAQTSGPLWYIRAYLWFVMLSPLMLKAFKKLPWVTMLAPLGLSVVLGLKLVEIPGETGNAIQDFTTFASCWILGFAHNEGTLKKLKAYMIPSFAVVLMCLGLWWAGTHPGEVPWNFDEIAVANALWSLGFCAILLHYSPSWQELPGKLKGFDTPITLANNRAVTIYLWHEMAIMLAIPIIDQLWGLPVVGDLLSPYLGKLYQVLMFIFAWPLIAVAIASFGWAEDVAAKRKPRLWPNGAKKKQKQ